MNKRDGTTDQKKDRQGITDADKKLASDFLAGYPSELQENSLWPIVRILYVAYQKHDDPIFPFPREEFDRFAWRKEHEDDAFIVLQELTKAYIASVGAVVRNRKRIMHRDKNKIVLNEDFRETIENNNRQIYEHAKADVKITYGFLYLYSVLQRSFQEKKVVKLTCYDGVLAFKKTPANQKSYAFRRKRGKETKRFRLLRVMQSARDRYTTAEQLVPLVGYKNAKLVRKEIKELFRAVAKRLDLQLDDLLDPSSNYGYKMLCDIDFGA